MLITQKATVCLQYIDSDVVYKHHLGRLIFQLKVFYNKALVNFAVDIKYTILV